MKFNTKINSCKSGVGLTVNHAALLLLVLAALCPAALSAQNLDRYGGRKDIACTNYVHGWSTQKIGNRWWFCTPDHHGFFGEDVEYIIPDDNTAMEKMKTKYGGAAQWSEATLKRLRSWGFNTIGVYAYGIILPTATDRALPDRGYHSIKLPFFGDIRPALYAMRNPAISLWGGGSKKFLADPVKDIFDARSPFYNDWVPSGGVGDYFDPKMTEWMQEDIVQDRAFAGLKRSWYNDYLIGMIGDDGDELFGFENGSDFPTVPPGHTNPMLSLIILSESPLEVASSRRKVIYQDTELHTKAALRDMLKAKYHTIDALNRAWHSDYTTFDSTGTPVQGEAIATGDGSKLTFHHTLAKLHASRDSVQIFLGGHVIAGDTGNGSIYGPDVTGNINYDSGLLLLVFKPGQAPKNGEALTINYVQNGWGYGTGLMDEDIRPAHRAWLGNTWDGLYAIASPLRQMNPAVKEDLDAFLEQTAAWYFKMVRDGIHAQFPGTLVLQGVGSWGTVAPAPVLRAAAQYVDVLEAGDITASQYSAKLNFIARNYGDHPIMANIFLAANADSAFGPSRNPSPHALRTQEEKGQAYYKDVDEMLNGANSFGSHPYVGTILWSWMDMWSERTNWGLVSHLDNSYDGHEDVQQKVPCSPPLEKFTCGGEPGNYGDYISKVKEANGLWLRVPAGNSPE